MFQSTVVERVRDSFNVDCCFKTLSETGLLTAVKSKAGTVAFGIS
jgi:hypothetical protein